MSSLFTYDNFVHAFAGSVASGTAMSLFYPLDTVRSRLQVEDNRKSKNTLGMIMELIREEGFESLHRGLGPVLYSLFCSGFVYFYAFHGIRRVTGEKTALKDLAIGALAGTINVFTTTPLWVVNMRIKMQGAKVREGDKKLLFETKYNGLIDGLIKIWRKEGPQALWSGTRASLVLVSNPAIQFMIFESLKRYLIKLTERKQLSPYDVFLLGAVSKTVSTLISYPLQIVQSKKRYGSQDVKDKPVFDILADIVKRDGTSGLYKGLEAKLMQTVLTTAMMFVFYERIYSTVTKISKAI